MLGHRTITIGSGFQNFLMFMYLFSVFQLEEIAQLERERELERQREYERERERQQREEEQRRRLEQQQEELDQLERHRASVGSLLSVTTDTTCDTPVHSTPRRSTDSGIG